VRLLYTSDADLSRPSAERTHVTEIVNGLAAEGFSVHLTALMKGPYPVLHEGVELHSILPAFNRIPITLLSRRIQRFQATKLVESILTERRIEIAYERQGCDLVMTPAKRLGIPVVMEINGVPSSECRVRLSDAERKRIDEDWVATFRSADGIVVVSSGIRDLLVRLGLDETRIKVITNGVNTDIFHPLSRQECRKAVGIPENARVAIFVGNFRPYHNLELLVRSVGKIARQVPEFLLVLVGDSIGQRGLVHHPTIDYLKRIARENNVQSNIWFVGRKSQSLVPLYLNAADLGVSLTSLPAVSQTSSVNPIKTGEYMACGLAVVCTMATEIATELKSKKAGIIVELDVNQIADSVVWLLSNDRQVEKMGEAALSIARTKLTWQTKSRETGAFLRDLILDAQT